MQAGEAAHTEFDATLGMEPIIPVYTAPWATPLPVTTVIFPKEDALCALKVALADARHNSSTSFTDGSPGGRGGGESGERA